MDYSKYTDESFPSAKSFERFLKSGYSLKYDYVIIEGILYTMHEFDEEGLSVTWANKKHNKMMEVKTKDRYHEGYIDAEVEIYDATYLRNDINYAE